MYPTINHIDDVLPAIQGRDEFVVGKRDGYQFIDYNYAQSDSFDCPIRRECRGLKFDLDGKLLARPFHKFFNLHEKPHEIPDNWDDAVVMEKLDGSMIHPAMVNGELVFMTRAGITDQSRMAMEACKALPYGERLLRFCKNCLHEGWMWVPIFEFTSPSNQIVVRYTEPAITLLAVRVNSHGGYLAQRTVESLAHTNNIPHVRTFDHSLHDMDAFLHHVRELRGAEGYVVRVGQQFIKVKADEYVAAHRAKSGLLWEKDVLRLVLESKIDDVAALLSTDESDHLLRWSDKVLAAVGKLGREVDAVYVSCLRKATSRKTFADAVSKMPPYQKSWMFSILDGKPPFQTIKDWALKETCTTARARLCLDILGAPKWEPAASMAAAMADA